MTFKPKLASKATTPAPFSFQPKDEERFAKKEERIQEELRKQSEVQTLEDNNAFFNKRSAFVVITVLLIQHLL